MAIVGAACIAVVTHYQYQGSVAAFIANELQDLKGDNRVAIARLHANLEIAGKDVLFLSKTPPIAGIIRARANGRIDPTDQSSETQWLDRLATTFTGLLQERPEYFQIRFISADGRETVRVNRGRNGNIWSTPEKDLQNKIDRRYVAGTLRLQKGEIYVSNADLNRERGQIERPFRPVIRVATPAYDDFGVLLGVVVVNVDLDRLFGIVRASLRTGALHYITNGTGDYLDGPDETKSFGFEFDRRYRIHDDIPQLSSMFEDGTKDYSGAVELASQDYLASASRVPIDPYDPQRYLVLATLWPQANVAPQIAALRNSAALVGGGVLLLGVIVMAWLATTLARPLRMLTAAATRITAGERDIDIGQAMRRGDETGKLARAFGVMADTIKEREDDIRGKADDLARSNQELAQFAYVASHDLQEPLRMVDSYLGLLVRRYGDRLDGEAHEFIDYAVDGARRMKRLINDLLGYSRVSNRPLNVETIDSAAVVSAVVSTLAERIADNGGTTTVAQLPKIKGDPGQVERLFMNVIENAVKYRSETALRIDVSATRRGGFWEFAVSDNGIGIDPEFHEKIFEIFTRLHSREKHDGTGIGLASCRRIVERHGGAIWVEARPSGGSTFRFTLPTLTAIEEKNNEQ